MPRTLIFLFDGTSNDPTLNNGAQPTNVFWFNSLVSDSVKIENKKHPQISFYLPGIGSKFYTESIFGKIKQFLLGIGTDAMLMRAYINLISNFRPGDRVTAIGFSRGAIAARLFTRLVLDFGVLKNNSIQFFEEILENFGKSIEFSYAEYADRARVFREKYRNVMHEKPEFIFLGLFDCVHGSVDEDFRNFLTEVDDKCSVDLGSFVHLMSLHDIRSHFVLSRLLPSRASIGHEVWVPGVHSDVGGGYNLNEGLSLSLRCLQHIPADNWIRIRSREGRSTYGGRSQLSGQ